jgi:hypothetical protein
MTLHKALFSFAGPILMLALAAPVSPGGEMTAKLDAKAVFERLKQLEGTWTGQAPGPDGPMDITHVFRVSAAGSVLMETMMQGSDHEMINMYHLDGDDLIIDHYCAGANQPRLKLDLATATEGDLPFVFDGGDNLDPAKDPHIHGGRLVLGGPAELDSYWVGYAGGKEDHTIHFELTRVAR